jgi:hypothetical protein
MACNWCFWARRRGGTVTPPTPKVSALSLIMQGSPAVTPVNQPVVYLITVSNSGPDAVVGTVMTNNLAALGFNVTSAVVDSASGGATATGPV